MREYIFYKKNKKVVIEINIFNLKIRYSIIYRINYIIKIIIFFKIINL
jgi:hypothetical protein